MYLKKIELENVGPIEKLTLELPFQDGRPKPLIIVGENGSGKTILISHIVNALLVGKQEIYDDGELTSGKVYKYRSPNYVRSTAHFSYGSVKFDSQMEVSECQLLALREKFEETFGYAPPHPIWNQIGPQETSTFQTTFSQHPQERDVLFKKQCCLYFPVNRFEEPAWLNADNLKLNANYSDLKRLSRYSNRQMINIAPLKQNRDWLLDLMFDRNVYDLKVQSIQLGPQTTAQLPVFMGYSGPSSTIYDAVNKVLRTILRQKNARLGAGPRKSRQIAVMKDEVTCSPI